MAGMVKRAGKKKEMESYKDLRNSLKIKYFRYAMPLYSCNSSSDSVTQYVDLQALYFGRYTYDLPCKILIIAW